MATIVHPTPTDTPEVRRYNRIKRWLGISDAVIGFAVLVILLVTGWTAELRDWAYIGARQHYFLAVFLYVLMFSVLLKIISAPLDYYGFRLEHQYHLSNQKLRAWLWDEAKGWLLGLVLGGIFVEIIYGMIRVAPRALVDHRLGRVHRPHAAAGATGAGRALPHLLQVQAAGERCPARSPDAAQRASGHARARRL